MNPGVNVTVEASENQIVEVGYDGQEIVQPPLTLTEHLAKQAGKIDFGQVSDDEVSGATGDSQADDSGSDDGSPDPGFTGWPWESTRNKLRDALTELSVLSDVIAVATKECGKDSQGNPKRYMVLDGPLQVDPPENKPNLVAYLAKKKSLEAPAKILLQGAEQLAKLLQGGPKTSAPNVEDFHLELLKLRQNWRLKKVSHTILGDLSYRTAGSSFKQSGVFEVVKADMTESEVKSSLRVNVPSDLEGIAFIQVVIQKDQQMVTATLTSPNHGSGNLGHGDKEKMWQQKLEAAQNVLFCKELFSRLAKEAIQMQSPIPHMVIGNQITASLFPDIQLLVTLCHYTGEDEANGTSNHSQTQQSDHSPVLEHSLHQLLR